MIPEGHALLIGGPKGLHGQIREVGDRDRVKVWLEKPKQRRVAFRSEEFWTQGRYLTYTRSRVRGIYVLEGYEWTPDDAELAYTYIWDEIE